MWLCSMNVQFVQEHSNRRETCCDMFELFTIKISHTSVTFVEKPVQLLVTSNAII